MKDELCRRLINDESLKVLALRLFDNEADDLIQEIALIICQKSDEELEKLDKYFNFWAARTIMNLASKTGKLGKVRNRKFDVHEMVDFEYEPEIDERYEEVMNILDEMYWYDRDLFLTYVKVGSLSKVTKATEYKGIKGINRYSVWNNLEKVRKIVKEKMK